MDKIDIEDLVIAKKKRFSNEQGSVLHFLKASEECFCGFGEAYFSTIFQNVEKDWRLHKRAVSNVVVISGRIELIFEDPRPESSSFNATKK